MFDGANSFNCALDSWNLANVKDTSFMFRHAGVFNQPLDSWNVTAVTSMRSMFQYAERYDKPLNSWHTVSVLDMSSMFSFAKIFNQPLDSWSVSAVTDMSNMFNTARFFNQSLEKWNISAVNDMNSMFQFAKSFNQPLDTWNPTSIFSLESMFQYAGQFDQNLCHFFRPEIIAFEFVNGTRCPYPNEFSELIVCQFCGATSGPDGSETSTSPPTGGTITPPTTTELPGTGTSTIIPPTTTHLPDTGTLEPSITAAPSAPTMAPTTLELEILLVYQGDVYANEHSIQVKNTISGEVILSVEAGALAQFETSEFQVKMDQGDYEVEVVDEFGDGFSGESQGSLSLYYRGALIWEINEAYGSWSKAHFAFSIPLNGSGTGSISNGI
jgi:hypothetical protein